MERRLVIGASWKMNKTRPEARQYMEQFLSAVGQIDPALIQAYILPPFTAIAPVKEAIGDFPVEVGAQNVHWADDGAFTGEISPVMLAELGCSIVMIGHSERRYLFGETDETVNKRVLAAYRHNLTPLLCIGETAPEQEAGQTEAVLRRQLGIALQGIPADFMRQLLILYEPRWAIGQKEAAPPEYIQETHALLRRLVAALYDDRTARLNRLVYGGSVTLDNLAEILNLPDVDGCGVGRASWDAANFARLVRATEAVARQ